MPNILNIKPEDIDSKEKRSKYLVSIVGCGQKGILYANAFLGAGFNVACSDSDPIVTKQLAKGKTVFSEAEIENKLKGMIDSGHFSVTGEMKKAISKSDIVVITVSAKIDEKNKIDNSETLNILKEVGAALHSGVLVIFGEVATFGFTEGIMRETLENTSGLKAGDDFGLAYIPIHNLPVKPTALTNLELKIASIGKLSQDAALTVVKTITNNVSQVIDVKTAEIATLFAAVKRETNLALANELAVLCESANVDFFEILKLWNFNDPSFWPTTVMEENKVKAYLLLENAENLNVKLRLPTLARQINEDMVKHAISLTQEALRNCGKTLRRGRIAVLGAVNENTSTLVFVKMLELKGAKACLYDPTSKKNTSDSGAVRTSLNEAVEGADCIVVLTGEEQFKNLNLRKIKPLTKNPSVIVDLAGAFEPQKVEREGFIYRGLGRGTG